MKYPDTIVRRRQTPGMRDMFGNYVEGTVVETEFRANIQPLGLEDVDLFEGGGCQYPHRLKVFVPVVGALSAAFEDSNVDTVLIGTSPALEYVVQESMTWRRLSASMLKVPISGN